LALEYLAATCQQHEHEAHIITYGSRQDARSVVEAVLRLNPHVLGLSIAFQSCLTDSIYLVEQLRSAGFVGHITCGGHVPSFEYAALLRDCPALDSVVRHDGELTLIELLARLEGEQSLSGVAGLVWREGAELRIEPTRRPLQALDELPVPQRSETPRRLAGMPMHLVIGSRGCVGDCAYCCIRAFVRGAEGPAYRLRKPEAIASEIAALVDRHGPAAIFLEDDLFVLPTEAAAAARILALARCLDEATRQKCAIWAKARPDTLTQRVLDAAQELGIIHFFLGIENHSAARLKYLGRSHGPAESERALCMLRDRSLGVSFNVMLFDPDCTLDDVAINLDFLRAHLDLPWNICRTELYSGTELLQRVAAEGRLTGDYRCYGYVMRDTRAELMFRILRVCFRQRAFDATSMLNHIISLTFAYQLHQKLFPGTESDKFARDIESLAVRVHLDTLETLQRILDFAAHSDLEDTDGPRQFAVDLGFEINNRDLGWRRECEHYNGLLDARGRALARTEHYA
jgi:hypothetical protein